MQLYGIDIATVVIAGSFAAGLNVYATVGALGILGRMHVLALPSSLSVLESWPIIVVAIALFIVEFFADKIPGFDLLWNGLHTFIRVPVAALLSYRATAQMSPGAQLLAAAVGTVIALVAHSGKTAARAAVTPSPEPFSNAALSMTEDAGAIGLMWLASKHPYIAAGIALVLVVLLVLMVRWIVRAIKKLYRGARERWAVGFGRRQELSN